MGAVIGIAVVGARQMARARGRAILETGRATICAVASRHLANARAGAAEESCAAIVEFAGGAFATSACEHRHVAL